MSETSEQLIQDDWVCEQAIADAKNPSVLRGVRLLASETQEGRRKYPEPLRRSLIPVFERLNVYLNHPDITERGRALNAPRLYEERIGWVVEGSVAEDGRGLIGDLELNPEHPQAKSVTYDFNRKTPRIGISYRGKAIFSDNVRMVGECQSVPAVWGLDVVDSPGSGGSLRESMESYEQGKGHGEMMARMDGIEKTMADRIREHEEHKMRLDRHDGMHQDHFDNHVNHEGRLKHLETSLEECSEQYEAMGGKEHSTAMEQFREQEEMTAKKISEAQQEMAKLQAAKSKIPRAPFAANPMEARQTAAAPVVNGVGLKAPNFHKN